MIAQSALAPGQEPPRERIYPPVGSLALDLLRDALENEADTFRQLGANVLVARPRRVLPEREVVTSA